MVPSGDIYLNFTFFVALSVALFNIILQSKIFPSTFEKSRVSEDAVTLAHMSGLLWPTHLTNVFTLVTGSECTLTCLNSI